MNSFLDVSVTSGFSPLYKSNLYFVAFAMSFLFINQLISIVDLFLDEVIIFVVVGVLLIRFTILSSNCISFLKCSFLLSITSGWFSSVSVMPVKAFKLNEVIDNKVNSVIFILFIFINLFCDFVVCYFMKLICF